MNHEYDQSIAGAIRSTIADAQDLVRGEIALAKAELREEARRMAVGAAALGAAGVAAIVAVVFLLIAAAWALSSLFPASPWAGFAIVGGALLLIAVVLGMIGKRRFNGQRYLPLTQDTMKENMAWTRARKS
jgi:hypothetical protein